MFYFGNLAKSNYSATKTKRKRQLQKTTLLLLGVLFSLLTAHAQKVIIKGAIIDKQTQEAIPFANVFIKGTGMGLTTDENGHYKMEITLPGDSIGSSSIGYKTLIKKLPAINKEATIDFQLERSDYTFDDVVILPGENPAVVMMRKVVANKPHYNKNNLESYGYEVYNKLEIDFDEITDKFENRKLFKPFKFIFNNIDSTSEEKPYLPLFLSESVSDFYYRKNPVDRREIIKASKVSGVNNISISQFLGNLYLELDLNEDWIYLLQREFVSPISQIGLNTAYRYYIVDSGYLDNIWCYKLQFTPKRKGELTFDGDMWIADTAFAVKQISMKMSKDADVNFVRRVSIYTEFEHVQDSVWMVKKERLVINAIKPKEGPGIIGRKTASYKNFIVNTEKQTVDSLFRKEKSDIAVSDSANLRDEKYWHDIRHDTLTANEQNIYHMIDTIKSLPIVKSYITLVQTIYTGYVDVGPLSIGNLFSFVSNNQTEGWRFKFGLMTSNKFSKYVSIGGYAAYGLKDKKVKYGAELLWLIKKSPREAIAASYRSDLSTISNYNTFNGNTGLLSNFGIRRVEEGGYIPIKIVEVKELKASYYKEIEMGYSFKAGFVNRRLTPLGDFKFRYQMQAKDARPNRYVNSVTTTEFVIQNRLAWQEKFVSGEFNRLSLGSTYPIMVLQYAFSAKKVMHGDFAYHRLLFNISDNQSVGPLGKFWWNIEVGKTWGTLPFVLLSMPDVNESYIYNWNGFNTIKDYQYVADRYVKLIIDHHLGGVLFSRIPGINKLKLREVWSYRMWWGDMTTANRAANAFNMEGNPYNNGTVQLRTADKMPLMEISVGIENILRIIRIDMVWKLTHTDKRGTPFSFRYGNFGVRAALQLQF
jgi:hypothetical protein